MRERLHGDRTYFNRNMHIEATNVCVASCLFCSFARLKQGDPGAYTMSLEEAWAKLRARVDADEPLTEIHIVNGLHPGLPFDYYTELLARLQAHPAGDPPEVLHRGRDRFFAKLYGMTDEEVLRELRDAGLDSLPGGGAEIFAAARAQEDLRRQVRPPTSSSRCTASRIASACARTARCSTATSRRSRSASITCCALRALQDETGGFQAFIPLAFHPDNNG